MYSLLLTQLTRGHAVAIANMQEIKILLWILHSWTCNCQKRNVVLQINAQLISSYGSWLRYCGRIQAVWWRLESHTSSHAWLPTYLVRYCKDFNFSDTKDYAYSNILFENLYCKGSTVSHAIVLPRANVEMLHSFSNWQSILSARRQSWNIFILRIASSIDKASVVGSPPMIQSHARSCVWSIDV